MRKERTLLILDGMEPLQNPPGVEGGRVRDPALATVVRELAAANNGLCVITTRVGVADVDQYEKATAPRVELENLSDKAGGALLRRLGVVGSHDELREASREFGGHGLALSLLGTYLRGAYEGDVRKRGGVPLLDDDDHLGRHARLTMASYEKWLGDGPELSALRLMGLFDRPAEKELVDVLRKPPAIKGLTDPLEGIREPRWRKALARLRQARLLAEADPGAGDTLDAHPLVREYFSEQLKASFLDAWREAHSRLYEHLTMTTKEFPDTLAEMAPLYQAVIHGCAGGRHQEVLEKVYDARILRRDEMFSTVKLGAMGASLSAVSAFFYDCWSQPVPTISTAARAFVFNQAGFLLRNLGRLREAAKPMQAGVDADIALGDWKNAARDVANLGELHLAMGEVARAVDDAVRALELATHGGDHSNILARKTDLASARHQLGAIREAKLLFDEAEQIQKVRQPQYKCLSSIRGYQYCELLLDYGKYEEVRQRASQTIEVAQQRQHLLSIALDHLSLGRALLLAARKEGSGDFSAAEEELDKTVDGIRRAGR